MLQFFRKIIISKTLFFLVTTTIILALNLTPPIVQFQHAPQGRTFALIHNNAQDFFFYQSLMNQGANGAWLTSDPYTSEPHQSSVIFSYFLWLGKLSKLLGLPYAITYHLTRIILSIFFLYTVYRILYTVFKVPHPRLTYLFFLLASPFMHKTADGFIVPYMNWWTGMDPIRRVAYLPHHMFGGLFLVISIILIIKFSNGPKLKYLLSLIFINTLLAFIHTPSLLILLLVLPLTIIISLTQNTKYQILNTKFIGLLIYWVTGLLMLLFMVFQTKTGFPWSQYIDWEKNLQFPLDRELIGAMGILFPFSILGAWQAIKSKKFEYILVTCWLFIPFLFIPIAPKIGLSNIRLIQGVPYLPLAILAIFGISCLENIFIQLKSILIKSKIKNQKSKIHIKDKIDDISRSNVKFSQRTHGIVNYMNIKEELNDNKIRSADSTVTESANIVSKKISHASGIEFRIAVLITFFIFTYPTLQWSLRNQIREYWPIFGNVYLDNRLNNAFAFVNQNLPPKTVTLGTFYTGNYLPAFTRTVSYIGHFGYTYNIDEKDKKARKFFENKMTVEEAKDHIVNNNITLIWQGPEEKPIYKDYLYPKILKPVYDKEEVTIYRLK